MPPPTENDPLDFSDRYNTPIPPERQKEFDSWRATQSQKTGRDPIGDRYDYDINGFFLSNGQTDERGHSSDQFKKPNHPTFSDQSQYNGADGHSGGTWIDKGGRYYFQPSATNINFHGADGLKQYFANPTNGELKNVFLAPPKTPQDIGRQVGDSMGKQVNRVHIGIGKGY